MTKKGTEKGSARIKHSAYLWIKDKRIHPSIAGHRKLRKYLRDIERDLISQYTGSDGLTPAKEIMIKSVIEAYGFILLGAVYCKRDGILNPVLLEKGIVSFQPILSNQFIAFMNSIRQNLISLGMDRKDAERVLSPMEYSQQFDEKKAKKVKKGIG